MNSTPVKQNIRIGLTYTGSKAKHENYVNWLRADDKQIEVIKLSAALNNLDALKDCDAVVLSGGVDAHPKNYGSNNTNYPNAPEQFQEDRDDFETAVFNLSQELHIPVLAICRGMQLVNCILGGDLIQDIGPEANGRHRHPETDEQHDIEILPNTLLYEITQSTRDTANSAHHQCVNHLGKRLQRNAISEDGITEGYEWADKSGKSFLLGVQWHPERMYRLGIENSTLSFNIRNYFISAVSQSIANRSNTVSG